MISQREARRLQRRVNALEAIERDRANQWTSQFNGGVNIYTLKNLQASTLATVATARALGHAVVVVDDGDELLFYGLKLQGRLS